MNLLKLALSIALLSSASILTFAAEADPVVKVAAGQIRGRLIEGGGATFKGVPYAEPPLGELRWWDPTPVKAWTGVRDAGEYGPPCTQRRNPGSSEDCLHVNVWTPEWPAKSPRPVMVWLFGGSNMTGAASEPYLDGTSLSRRGVVLVTIDFRLGVFGFLAHPGLTPESSHHSSGNYGFLDQLAALKWVHDNIAKLGGDPGNVTLFGQSSGAMSTAFLVASPLAKGLIHRAIQESGPPIRLFETATEAEQDGVKFGVSMDAPPAPRDAIKYLRSLPGPELQKKIEAEPAPPGEAVATTEIDNYLISKYSALTYKEGNDLPIPMILGNNAREQVHDYKPEVMLNWIKGNFGSLAPRAEEFYGWANGGKGKSDPFFGPSGVQITADTRQRCPAIAQGIWRTSHGHATWEYMFDPPVAGEAFTKHTAEIPFVFGNLRPSGPMGGPYTEADKGISANVQTYWTNFAKTGNPNGNGLPEWPKFDPAARPYLEFTLHNGPVVKENLRRDICDLFIEALPETIPINAAGSYPK